MRIARTLLDELVAHALEDAPNECCGMVATRDGDAVRVHRVRNATPSPFGFVMDSMDQYRATMAIEDDDLEIGAMYHSHTRTDPYPSQTDISFAQGWGPQTLWVIVGLAGGAPVIRTYRIDGADVREL